MARPAAVFLFLYAHCSGHFCVYNPPDRDILLLDSGKKWYFVLIKMFIGKYYHRVEEKGRVSLPKIFRDQSESFVVTRGLDGGLFLFPLEEFQTQLTALKTSSFTKKINRDFTRLLTNEAQAVIPDKNGRVQLPEYLTTFAHITKDVVIVGSYSYIELWDRETYHLYLEGVEQQAETIAESINAN